MIRHDGVRIDRIAPDGPADQAGLRIGDDILALDGIYLFTVEELMNETHLYKPGAKLSVRYRRRSTIYESVIITGAEETQKTAIDATE
jgi:predicted metalloprotease with PDZ domain